MDQDKLRSALGGLDWPASRQDIWDKARENGADDEVMNALQSLPDMEYENMDIVNQNLGGGMGSEGMEDDEEM